MSTTLDISSPFGRLNQAMGEGVGLTQALKEYYPIQGKGIDFHKFVEDYRNALKDLSSNRTALNVKANDLFRVERGDNEFYELGIDILFGREPNPKRELFISILKNIDPSDRTEGVLEALELLLSKELTDNPFFQSLQSSRSLRSELPNVLPKIGSLEPDARASVCLLLSELTADDLSLPLEEVVSHIEDLNPFLRTKLFYDLQQREEYADHLVPFFEVFEALSSEDQSEVAKEIAQLPKDDSPKTYSLKLFRLCLEKLKGENGRISEAEAIVGKQLFDEIKENFDDFEYESIKKFFVNAFKSPSVDPFRIIRFGIEILEASRYEGQELSFDLEELPFTPIETLEEMMWGWKKLSKGEQELLIHDLSAFFRDDKLQIGFGELFFLLLQMNDSERKELLENVHHARALQLSAHSFAKLIQILLTIPVEQQGAYLKNIAPYLSILDRPKGDIGGFLSLSRNLNPDDFQTLNGLMKGHQEKVNLTEPDVIRLFNVLNARGVNELKPLFSEVNEFLRDDPSPSPQDILNGLEALQFARGGVADAKEMAFGLAKKGENLRPIQVFSFLRMLPVKDQPFVNQAFLKSLESYPTLILSDLRNAWDFYQVIPENQRENVSFERLVGLIVEDEESPLNVTFPTLSKAVKEAVVEEILPVLLFKGKEGEEIPASHVLKQLLCLSSQERSGFGEKVVELFKHIQEEDLFKDYLEVLSQISSSSVKEFVDLTRPFYPQLEGDGSFDEFLYIVANLEEGERKEFISDIKDIVDLDTHKDPIFTLEYLANFKPADRKNFICYCQKIGVGVSDENELWNVLNDLLAFPERERGKILEILSSAEKETLQFQKPYHLRMFSRIPPNLRDSPLFPRFCQFFRDYQDAWHGPIFFYLENLPKDQAVETAATLFSLFEKKPRKDFLEAKALVITSLVQDVGKIHATYQNKVMGQRDFFLEFIPEELRTAERVEEIRKHFSQISPSLVWTLKLLTFIPSEVQTTSRLLLLAGMLPNTAVALFIPPDLYSSIIGLMESRRSSQNWTQEDLLDFLRQIPTVRERVVATISEELQLEHTLEETRAIAGTAIRNLRILGINEESPLFQEATYIYNLTLPETLARHNPFGLVTSLRELRASGKLFNVSPLPEVVYVEEKSVVASFDLFELRKHGKETAKVLKNSDLPVIDSAIFDTLFSSLEERIKWSPDFAAVVNDRVPKLHEDSPLTRFEELKMGFMSPFILNLLTIKGKGEDPVDPIQLQLFAIIKSMMVQSKERKGPFSPQEEMFLRFTISVQECRVGQKAGVSSFYQHGLESKDRLVGLGAEATVEEKAAYVVDQAIQELLEETFSNPRLLVEATGVDSGHLEQAVHDTLYLKNLLSYQVGLAGHKIEFDPYSIAIEGELLTKSPELLLKNYLSYLEIQRGIKILQRDFTQMVELTRDDGVKSDYINGFNGMIREQLLKSGVIEKAADLTQVIDEYIDYSDPDQVQLTSLGALTLLQARGYLLPR